MHRVENGTGVWSNGDEENGVPGTRIMAEWLQDLQESIAYVIESAGLSLEKGNNTQLANAILAAIEVGDFQAITTRIRNLNAAYTYGAKNIFERPDEPTLANTGVAEFFDNDIWVDTDDNRKTYLWNTMTESWVDTSNESAGRGVIATQLSTAIADGFIDYYIQEDDPASATEGDVWFVPSSGRLSQKSSSGVWIEIVDPFVISTIKEVIVSLAAATAQGTADQKIRTWYQPEPPTGLTSQDDGDLWFDTNDNNKLYRYAHPSWVLSADRRIATAIDLMFLQQDIADGVIQVYFFDIPPTEANQAALNPPNLPPSNGDVWIDISDNGSGDPKNDVYRFDVDYWVAVSDPDLKRSLLSFASQRATADGSVTIYFSDSAPTSASVPVPRYGDIWYDTSLESIPDENAEFPETAPNISVPRMDQYRFDGTIWVPIENFRVKLAFARLTIEENTRASENEALASQITTATTTLGEHTATIQQSLVSINGIAGAFAIRANVNGVSTGFGLITDYEREIEFTHVGTSTFNPADVIFAGASWAARTYSAVIVSVDNLSGVMRVISESGTYSNSNNLFARDRLTAQADPLSSTLNPTPGTSEFNVQVDRFKVTSTDGLNTITPLRVENGVLFVGAMDTSNPTLNYLGEFSSDPDTNSYQVGAVYRNTADNNTYILQYVSGTSGPKVWSVFLQKGANAKTLTITSDGIGFVFSSPDALTPTNSEVSFTVQYSGMSSALSTTDLKFYDSTNTLFTTPTLTGVSVSNSVVSDGSSITNDGQLRFRLPFSSLTSPTFPIRIAVEKDIYQDDTAINRVVAGVAKSIRLSADNFAFIFPDSVATTPNNTTISFTVQFDNVATAPTVFDVSVLDSDNDPFTIDNFTSDTGSTGTASFDLNWADVSTAVFPLRVIISDEGIQDTVSIHEITGGSGSVVGYLTNESHTVPCDETGSPQVGSLASAAGVFNVFYEISNVNPLCTFTVASTVGCSATIDNTGTGTAGQYVITALSANLASATFTAVYGPITITKVMSISKSIAGVNARSLSLSATSNVFKYDGLGGSLGPSTITLTAIKQNLGAVTWSVVDQNNTAVSNTILGAGSSGDEKIITAASFASYTRLVVTASASATVSGNVITISDKYTISRLGDGAPQFTVILSNENHTYTANELGTISSFTAGNCAVTVFVGSVSKSYNATPTNDTFRFGSLTVSNMSATNSSNTITPTAMSADEGYVDVPVIYRNTAGVDTTITKRITYSKVKSGYEARLVRAISSENAFRFNRDDKAIDPSQTITFSVDPINFATGFYNRCEGADVSRWTVPASNTLVAVTSDKKYDSGCIRIQSSVAYTSINSNNIPGGVYFQIPKAIVDANFAGQTVTVRFWAKSITSTSMAVAYSTNDNGTSGWQLFSPTASWAAYEFTYAVPANNTGLSDGDYVTFLGDATGTNKQVLIDQVSVFVSEGFPSADVIVKAYNETGAEVTLTNTSKDVYSLSVTNFGSAEAVTFSVVAHTFVDGVIVRDTVSVNRVRDGDESIDVALSNENHTFPADEDGVIAAPAFAAGVCEIKVYRGLTEVPFSTGNVAADGKWWVSATVFGAGLSASHSNGIITPSALTVDAALASITVSYRNTAGVTTSTTRIITYSRSKAGVAARSVSLLPSSQIFLFNGDGEAKDSGQVITLTAVGFNLSPEWEWEARDENDTVINSVLTTVNSNTRSISISNFGNRARVKVTVSKQQTVAGVSRTFSDVVTLTRVQEASNGIAISLSNENHTFVADENGTIAGGTYAGGNCVVSVYRGLSTVSYNAVATNNTWRFLSVTSSNVGLVSPTPTSSTISVSAMSVDNGTLTAVIRYQDNNGSTYDFTRIITYTRSKATSKARVVYLNPSDLTFQFTGDNIPVNSSQEITFTASGFNLTQPWTWAAVDDTNTVVTNLLTTVDANTRKITITNFGSRKFIRVTVSKDATVDGVAQTFSDVATVSRLSNSADGITTILSNESHSFYADENGTVSNFTGSACEILLYRGLTLVNYAATLVNNTWKVNSVTASAGLTVAPPTIAAAKATITPTALSSDTATATVSITYRNTAGVDTTFTKVITYTRGKSGVNARSVRLTSNGSVFLFNGDGTAKNSAQEILLTATGFNVAAPWTWSAVNQAGTSVTGILTTTANTNERKITITNFGTNQSVVVTVSKDVTVNGVTQTVSDRFTLTRIQEASESIAVSLSNENHTFLAAEDGTVSDYTGGACAVAVYRGSTSVTYSASAANDRWRYISVTPSTSNLVMSAPSVSGVLTPVSMSVDAASVTLVIAYRNISGVDTQFTRTISYNKSRAGFASRSVTLQSTGLVFQFTGDGLAKDTGQYIEFTATGENIAAPWEWEARNQAGVDVSSILTTVDANTRRITIANFGANQSVTITVSKDATVGGSSVTFSDQITVYRLEEKKDGMAVLLTNESHTFAADENGTIASYAGGVCTVRVYRGSDLITYNGTATNNTWRFGTITTTGISQSNSTGTITPSAMTADTASISLPIIYQNSAGQTTTFTRVISYARSREGIKSRAITLTASGMIFIFTGDNLAKDTGQEILITASGFNIDGTFLWSAVNQAGTTINSVLTTTTNPNERKITIANFGANQTITVTAYKDVTVNGVTSTIKDSVTLTRVVESVAAVEAILSNENHTFIADEAGTISGAEYTGGVCAFTVYRGAELIGFQSTAANNKWRFGTVTQTAGLQMSPPGNGTITPVSLTVDSGQATVPIIYRNTAGVDTTITKTISYSRANAGSNARALSLAASGNAFVFTGDNTALDSGQEITFTASGYNLSPEWEWEARDNTNTVVNGILTTVNSNTRKITIANFGSRTRVTVKVWKTVTINGVSKTFEDTVTVVRIREAANGLTVLLSNEAHTFYATDDGSVPDYDDGACTVSLFRGLNAVTKNDSGTVANTWRFGSILVSNINYTLRTGVVAGDTIVPRQMVANQATITVPVIYRNEAGVETTVTKRITYAKSVKGVDGDIGITVSATNASHTFSTDISGNLLSGVNWSDGNSSFRVYAGSTQLAYSAVPVLNSYRFGTITATDVTRNTGLSAPTVGISAMSGNTGRLSVPIIVTKATPRINNLGFEGGTPGVASTTIDGWLFEGSTSAQTRTGFTSVVDTASNFESSVSYGTLSTSTSDATHLGGWFRVGKKFNVDSASYIRIRCKVHVASATTPASFAGTSSQTFIAEDDCYAEIRCFDAAGAEIVQTASAKYSKSLSHKLFDGGSINTNIGGTWSSFDHTFTLPAGVSYVQLFMVAIDGGAAVRSLGYVAEHASVRFDDAEFYSDGSIYDNTVEPTLIQDITYAKARQGSQGTQGVQGVQGPPGPQGNPGTNGSAGAAGQRGSMQFYASGLSWSDTVANNAITVLGLTKVLNDVVTISGTGFAQTRYWNNSIWTPVAQVIDGNLVVQGTLSADAIATGTLNVNTTIKVNDGIRDRILMGKLSGTAGDYGILIVDASGNTILRAGSSSGYGIFEQQVNSRFDTTVNQIDAANSSINQNPQFTLYTNTTGLPDRWSNWTGITSSSAIRNTGLSPQVYAMTMNSAANTQVGMTQALNGRLTQGTYYVLEAKVTLVSGTLAGAGVFLRYGETVMNNTQSLIFSNERDVKDAEAVGGQAVGNGIVGNTYQFSMLFQITTACNLAEIFAMGHFSSWPPITSANSIQWHKCLIRPAVAGEVKASVSASVSQMNTAISTAVGAQATRIDTVESRFAVSNNLMKHPSPPFNSANTADLGWIVAGGSTGTYGFYSGEWTPYGGLIYLEKWETGHPNVGSTRVYRYPVPVSYGGNYTLSLNVYLIGFPNNHINMYLRYLNASGGLLGLSATTPLVNNGTIRQAMTGLAPDATKTIEIAFQIPPISVPGYAEFVFRSVKLEAGTVATIFDDSSNLVDLRSTVRTVSDTASNALSTATSLRTEARSGYGRGGTNLLINTDFVSNNVNNLNNTLDGWFISGRNTTGLPYEAGVTGEPPTGLKWTGTVKTLYAWVNGTPTAGTWFDGYASAGHENLTDLRNYSPRLQGNERIWFGAYVGMHRCHARVYLGFYSLNGTFLSEEYAEGTSGLNGTGGEPNAFERIGRFATVPANARYCSLWVRGMALGGQAAPYIFFGWPMVSFASAEQTAAPQYLAGRLNPLIPQQLSETEASASLALETANRADGRIEADIRLVAAAGGAPAYVRLTANNSGQSDLVLGAKQIILRNEVNGQVIDALSVVGGNARFSGDLSAGGRITIGSANWPVGMQPKTIQAADGQSIQWANGTSLGKVPFVTIIPPSGVVLGAGEAWKAPTISNMTPVGGTLNLRIIVPGSISPITLTNDYAGSVGQPSRVMDKTTSGDDYNGIYQFVISGEMVISVYTTGDGFTDEVSYNGYIAIKTWFNDGTGWYEGTTVSIDHTDLGFYDGTVIGGGGTYGVSEISQTFTRTFDVPIGQPLGNGKFGISLHPQSAGAIYDLAQVSWETQSSSFERSGSPEGQKATIIITPDNS